MTNEALSFHLSKRHAFEVGLVGLLVWLDVVK